MKLKKKKGEGTKLEISSHKTAHLMLASKSTELPFVKRKERRKKERKKENRKQAQP